MTMKAMKLTQTLKKQKQNKMTRKTISLGDGADFFEKQMQHERELANELTREHNVPERLLVEHSIQEVAEFFKAHEKSIATHHYLYRVSDEAVMNLFGASDFSLAYPWCLNDERKTPLALGSALYVLFNRQERNQAVRQQNQPRALFHNLSRKHSPLLPVKKEPLESIHFSKGNEDEYIDVWQTEEPVNCISTSTQNVKEVIDSLNDVPIVSKKREFKEESKSLTPFLDTIVTSNEIVSLDHEEEIYQIEPYRKKQRQEVRALVENLKYTAKLENQLRQVESEKYARELDELRTQLQLKEEAMRLQEKELQLKLQENAFLKEKDLFYQQQQQQPSLCVKNVKKPRARPPPKKAVRRQTQPIESQPQQELAIVPVDLPVIETLKATEEARLAQEREQIAIANALALAEDRRIHSTLIVREKKNMNGLKSFNIGVGMPYCYKLRDVLEPLLDQINNEKNDSFQAILDHPFFNEYRVSLLANIPNFDTTTTAIDEAALLRFIDSELFKTDTLAQKLNLSNLMVHLWFLAKAIEYNKNEGATKHTHEIQLLSERRYNYDAAILAKWYPWFNSGKGYIVTEDLRMPARSLTKGQGDGKCCQFCEMQFVGATGGVLKHSHHLKYCDLLANISNDERVILQVIMERKQFAAHVHHNVPKAERTRSQNAALAFAQKNCIATYGEETLLRLATQEEIFADRFVTCPLSGDRVRINMPWLMEMRSTNWDNFVKRIALLDTAADEKNLNARPIANLIDCFQFAAPKHKTKVHMNALDGLLYKSLVDYEGKHYMTSKINPSKPEDKRSFLINPATGFGDGVFFSMPYEEEIRAIEPLVFDAAPQQQQQQQQEEVQYQESNIVWDKPTTTTTTTTTTVERQTPFSYDGGDMLSFSLVNQEEQPNENSMFGSPSDSYQFQHEFSFERNEKEEEENNENHSPFNISSFSSSSVVYINH